MPRLSQFAVTVPAGAPYPAGVLLTTDWATVATFATAVGTLVLAFATFAAVHSANRAARVAEAAFQANLRPVLVPSRLEDPVQKIRWLDHWAILQPAQGDVELVDNSIYLAISLRNVGAGLAVPIGWYVFTETQLGVVDHVDPEQFRMQQRDLFVGAGDFGFWQAAIREVDDPSYVALSKDVRDGEAFTIDLLYGDHEGGQRTISRFNLVPVRVEDELRWYPTIVRHWNLDRPDPR